MNNRSNANNGNRYFELFDSAPFGYAVLERSGLIVDINRTAADMLGIEKEHLIRDKFSSFVSPDYESEFEEHLANGTPCEIRLTKTDGTSVCARLAGTVEKDGNLIKTAIVGLREARPDDDCRAEPKYETIFKNAPLGIFRSTLKGKFIEVNPALAKMLGYETPADVIENAGDIGKDVYAYPERSRELLEFIKRNPETVRFESTFRKRDGTVWTALLNVKVIRGKNGALKFIEGMVEDISDRKRMENDILDARKMAEQANRAKGEFLANMSHEIRTPVNGIISAVKMVLDSDGLAAKHREILEIVAESARVLMILINQVLDLSKIEAGKLELAEFDFDFHCTVEKIVQTFAIQAGEKGLNLTLRIAPDVPKNMYGDPERLGQILRNLVSNAIKFTEEGDITVSVKALAGTGTAVNLIFSVSDTGIGIWPEKIPNLFRSFSQIDSRSKNYNGTGLGLAISKKLVNIMNGNIWVESKRGHGSTFFFNVSCKKSGQRKKTEDMSLKEIPSIPPQRILLAEDNTLSKMTLAHFLAKAGHDVTTVSNGVEVIYAMKSDTYDLILMDVQMPQMDGVETTRLIRSASSDEFNPGIPIIALTAYAMKGDRQRFIEAGMDEYVAKPVEVEDLFHIIARVLSLNPAKRTKTENEPAEDENCVADIHKLLDRFHGQDKFLSELFRNFINESGLTIDKINKAFDAGDSGALSTAAHSMVNITGFIKLNSAVHLARRLEALARAGDIEEAGPTMESLNREIEKSVEFIKTLQFI